MTRPKIRRSLRLESLESRQLLTGGGPTADQQYMLELLNLARTNPAEMADRVTTNLSADVQATVDHYNIKLTDVNNAIARSQSRQPLAWNDTLAQTATGQSQYQDQTGVQSHTGANGSNLEQRLDQAGYTNRASDGENAFAYSQSVDESMEAFLIDWGVSDNGHRNNILQPDTADQDSYREVGIGIVDSSKPGFGPLVITNDFGSQKGAKADLLGVAYNDPGLTHFYAPGEGRGDVTIEVKNESTGATQSVQTWASGGYQIPLDSGTYKVTASVDGKVFRSQDVVIGTENVKIDYDMNDPSYDAKVAAPAPGSTPSPSPSPAAMASTGGSTQTSQTASTQQEDQVAEPSDASTTPGSTQKGQTWSETYQTWII